MSLALVAAVKNSSTATVSWADELAFVIAFQEMHLRLLPDRVFL